MKNWAVACCENYQVPFFFGGSFCMIIFCQLSGLIIVSKKKTLENCPLKKREIRTFFFLDLFLTIVVVVVTMGGFLF